MNWSEFIDKNKDEYEIVRDEDEYEIDNDYETFVPEIDTLVKLLEPPIEGVNLEAEAENKKILEERATRIKRYKGYVPVKVRFNDIPLVAWVSPETLETAFLVDWISKVPLEVNPEAEEEKAEIDAVRARTPFIGTFHPKKMRKQHLIVVHEDGDWFERGDYDSDREMICGLAARVASCPMVINLEAEKEFKEIKRLRIIGFTPKRLVSTPFAAKEVPEGFLVADELDEEAFEMDTGVCDAPFKVTLDDVLKMNQEFLKMKIEIETEKLKEDPENKG